MKIHFVTPTRLSLINLTTIGDSEKREDDSKIGQFSSGQAYATALLLRDSVGLEVNIYGGYYSEDEKYTEVINYSTANKICESTGKSKEIIVLDYEKQFHGNCNSAQTFSEGHTEADIIETAYALQLGYNWENWMILRELWSNMLDEGGYVVEKESYPEPEVGTVITLTFDENNKFYETWQNRHLYINEKAPLYTINYNVDVLENEEGYLRIYKQNILVYEDEKRLSLFAYNIKSGTIDERRILSNVYSVESDIVYAIKSTTNEEFLRQIITKDFDSKNQFLDSMSVYGSASDLAHRIACEVYDEFGEVNSYSWLINSIKERTDCGIGGKKIKSIGDAIYSYSNTVTVETTPETFSTPEVIETEEEILEDSFAVEIRKYYKFKLDVEVKKAKLRGSKVIADKFNKCLIIDEEFNIIEDFPELIVQYIDLTRPGNVVKELSKYICELISN